MEGRGFEAHRRDHGYDYRTLDQLPYDGRAGGSGALAQLVERLVCNQEVVGSIPTRSMAPEGDTGPAAGWGFRA